uniref:Dolichyl-diphosphooligosaccharide--protein glycosyltransferase subunit DAD1 n=2 Tax=Anopheles stephensi TaxID=30069 RepID=A0A182Y5J7_ANOST
QQKEKKSLPQSEDLRSVQFLYSTNFHKTVYTLPDNQQFTMKNLTEVLHKFYDEYTHKTPKKLKIVDAYLLYILLTGITQFVYCCLVGTFPFNSFLAGFISTVSCFVLGVCLRLQSNPQNKEQFFGISPERGFADFVFAHIILHLVVFNFIG